MQTIEQVTDNLKANLDDPRMHAMCLFIDSLIKRPSEDDQFSVFRIYNVAASFEIETIEDFIENINHNFVIQSYPFSGERLGGDRVTGYNLTLSNLEVRFDHNSADDVEYSKQSNFFGDYGCVYLFSFYMAYMNDNDIVLPLKISSIKLIPQETVVETSGLSPSPGGGGFINGGFGPGITP